VLDIRERVRRLSPEVREALLRELEGASQKEFAISEKEAPFSGELQTSAEELLLSLEQPETPWKRKGRTKERRVVITGLGAITSLSCNAHETWQKLVAGRSGIHRITRFDVSAYPTKIGGEVNDFDALQYMDRKEARRMSRFSQFAVAGTKMALADAGLTIEPERAEEVGILLGVASTSLTEVEEISRQMTERGALRPSPFFLTTIIPNMAAFNVSRHCGCRGYSSTISTSCATGTHSIGEAAEVIRRGQAEVMIAGGSEASHCEIAWAGFCAMGAFSTRNDDPEGASRPFDKERDGFVGAEGCAILILESLEHALARGARIYAEVLGCASVTDGYHVASPHPEALGPAQAMRLAMQDAGLCPQDIGYINAHGTATPLNDAIETLAIKKALGEYAYRVPISSTKSMLGHPISAAGAIEAMASTLTIYHGIIHPTINYHTPDPDCDLDYVPNVARQAKVRIALSNSFGLGSQNACLALGRFEG